MGAGIAVAFRARYPAMYEAYRARCRAEPRQFNLGDAWLWQEAERPAVFNLGTQETYWRGRRLTRRASQRSPCRASGPATAVSRGARCAP